MSKKKCTKAHVICLNDAPMAVVVGLEKKAQEKAMQMKNDHIKKDFYWMIGDELEQQKGLLFYHLHTVDVFFIN